MWSAAPGLICLVAQVELQVMRRVTGTGKSTTRLLRIVADVLSMVSPYDKMSNPSPDGLVGAPHKDVGPEFGGGCMLESCVPCAG